MEWVELSWDIFEAPEIMFLKSNFDMFSKDELIDENNDAEQTIILSDDEDSIILSDNDDS